MPSRITSDEVRYVAKLARLHLAPEEIDRYTEQLDQILGYVAKLEELDTTDIVPTTHALSIQNAFREDTIRQSLSQREALANAPLENGEAFIVPKVI